MIRKEAALLFTFLVSLNLSAHAQAQAAATEQSGAYFSIQDSPRPAAEVWQTPDQVLQSGFQALMETAARLDLLHWVRHEGALPESPEPYNRKAHFGPWINDPTDETCYNTRAKVLIRDSTEPVKYKDKNHCAVESGRWVDPYAGAVRTLSRDIQIDHVVPLKNAFGSGAWKWSTLKRCLYANFLGNEYHLIPVDGHENMSKGDSAPDEYLPPNSKYVCTYLQEWLKIKLIWKLDMTESEAQAIRDQVQQYGCDMRSLKMSEMDLHRQRVATTELQDICVRMAAHLNDDPSSIKDHPTTTSFQ